MKFVPGALALVLSLGLASSSHADVGEAFGFGSKSASLGGITTVSTQLDPYASYANPAGLSTEGGGERLVFGYSVILMDPIFASINNIVINNSFVSDASGVPTISTPRTS